METEIQLPTGDDTEALFARISESNTFKTAPMMRGLLLYLWQHRSEPINEYAIAVEALGRRADFDPKTDATVRVQIARLRTRLKEFYEHEAEAFPLQLSIPLGGHQLECTYRSPAPVAASANPVNPPTRPRGPLSPSRMFLGFAFICIALVLLCLSLFLENRELRVSSQISSLSRSPLPPFWQSFLNGGKPTTIVVPTPAYLSWPDQQVLVRDLNVTNYADWSSSAVLVELARRWGPPQLAEIYVVVSHMIPAVEVLEYLVIRGFEARLSVSASLGVDSYRDQNVIVVGGPRNTARFQAFLTRENFKIVSTSPTVVRNVNPKPGERQQYEQSAASAQHIMFPGIIALLPRSSEGTRSLLLIGRSPAALVSMLLSTEGLRHVDDHWSRGGRPEAWEMVVEAELNGETVLSVRPVAFRATVN